MFIGKLECQVFWTIKLESNKVKYFGSLGVPMVTVLVPLFSSSTCVLVAVIFIVRLHWVHSCVH
jgi:hypothetical protein